MATKNPQRTVLPIPDRPYAGPVMYDAKDPDSKFPAIEPLRPPRGAPNILVVLLDDVGFGASSAFGGPCFTATAERLAEGGLKLTRFHTTALCSPTRAALLTGRNHHAVGMGGITEIATSAPGYDSMRPNTMAPVAEILKLNGYSTAQFGKCHEVPVWETSPVGPFTRWPTGSGFEYFFGFVAGETNQYHPALYENTSPVEPNATPEQGYHFMQDMTDRAIGWVRQQKSLAPDKPFFMYFAPGATHAPHHVPKAWADKYKGRFDAGWDKLREETFARQKKLGVIPKDAKLTPRPAEIPAWDDIPADLRPVLAREMELYAGFLEYADHHIGRLIDAIEQLGALDDTLVYFIIGDNGASAEGGLYGTSSEGFIFNDRTDLETPEYLKAHIDEFGGPKSYNHYAVGWAHAMDTPYQWTKQVASHWGGTRNGAIVHWPRGIRAKGELRSQFAHVIDVAPTLLEAAGLPEPSFVNGVEQAPMHGVSMLYAFNDAKAAERHETQYFEMFGNRGIYHRGWTAVTKHRTPWVATPPAGFDDDVWELYDTTTDWTQAHDLARENPEKLHALQRLWLIEASRYSVLPLDDRSVERFNSELAGRPELVHGETQVLYPGMGRLGENTVLNLKNKSHSVTAEVEVRDPQGTGVIVAQGGSTGGWSLYLREGALAYCYNLLGVERYHVQAVAPVGKGKHHVRMEFAYDGGGLGKGGKVTLLVDDKRVGEGRVEQTQAMVFSADETLDIGRENGTTVSTEYPMYENEFPGEIGWVKLDVGDDDASGAVRPEKRLENALNRQ